MKLLTDAKKQMLKKKRRKKKREAFADVSALGSQQGELVHPRYFLNERETIFGHGCIIYLLLFTSRPRPYISQWNVSLRKSG